MARDENSHRDETGEADRLLVELLYGELDGDAATDGRARVEADPALRGDLEAYGRVRALLRELPEEEPSPAISTQLLHAAAHAVKGKAATPSAEKPGLWARLRDWMTPLALHPGLAAAATLVLVGGVAGTLYLRGESRVAEPRLPAAGERRDQALQASDEEGRGPAPAESSPAAPAAAPSAVAVPQMEPGRSVDLDDSVGGAAKSGKSDSALLAEPDSRDRSRIRGAELQKTGVPARKAKVADKSSLDGFSGDLGGDLGGASGASKGDSAGRGAGAASGAAPGGSGGVAVRGSSRGSIDVTTEEPATRRFENEAAGESAPTAPAPPAAPPPPSPAAPPPPPAPVTRSQPPPKPSKAPRPADGGAPDKASDTGDRSKALDLTKKATAAARRGDCAAAVSIGPDVRRLDSNVYDTIYLRDTAITTCRTAPSRAKK